MSDNGKILGVFAKEPSAGQAKTRLAEAASPAWAQRVAEAFLEDSLDRFAQVDASRSIVYAPAAASSFFARLSNGRFELVAQGDGDLGQRLQNFFAHVRTDGYSRIVAVGTDSPTLPIAYIEDAFRLLLTHDVVIGPAFDGGYYLIGGGPKTIPLFEAIPWSTARVLETTVERVRAASATLALLPPWYDVDRLDDWAMLRGHVLAMRQAGIDPGVPRVERLMVDETVAGIAR
jgi:rSAM/selenodomain-associated transferase 1